MGSEDELALEIVTEVADREGVDVTELRSPLYDAIDVDALEALLESASNQAAVSFAYCGYLVYVTGSGTVRVTDLARESESAGRVDPVGSRG